MTIIAGLVASDGVVLAADSQATDLEAQVRTSTEKLWKLGRHYVWGASGSIGVAQYVKTALEYVYRGNWPEKPLLEVRSSIGKTIADQRKQLITDHLVSNQVPGFEVLVAGITKAGTEVRPVLLEYPSDGMSEEHFKFCAIGSGKKAGYHAFESLRHYEPHQRQVELAKLFLYRIMHDAIRAESWGVGGDVHLWVVTESGAEELPKSELDGLGQLLENWLASERASLSTLMTTPVDPADDESVAVARPDQD